MSHRVYSRYTLQALERPRGCGSMTLVLGVLGLCALGMVVALGWALWVLGRAWFFHG